MEPSIAYTADAQQLAIIQRKLFLDNRIRSGINWFYWIAGLSLVNTLAYLFGATITFMMGLGITQFIDAFIFTLVKDLGSGSEILRGLGLVIDVAIAGIFVLLGYFGRKRVRWVVIVGMAFYGLDALLMLAFRDFLAAAFHLLALWGLWGGWKAIGELADLEKSGGSEPVDVLRQRIPTSRPERPYTFVRFGRSVLGILVAFAIFVAILMLINR
jgi:hypothetical protein